MISVRLMFLLLLLGTLSCSAFGSNPSGGDLERIQGSPRYDKSRGMFVNRRASILEDMRERFDYWKMFNAYLFENNIRVPEKKLPEIIPDFKEFTDSQKGMRFIWFGHSTFLVNIEGKILLFDPVFSGAASPVPLFVRRFQPPVVTLKQLPPVDYILISHDHYDHLDMETIEFFRSTKTQFITPLGVSSHIKSWGVPVERTTELDWWDSLKLGTIEIVLTPAQHFSGRVGMDQNKTLWGSYVVRSARNSFFFSGDSGYDTHFREIGDKYGPFDITFIENGQYNPMWREVHVLPEETAQAFIDLQGKNLVPVHWGMFSLATHDWYEPIEALEKESIKRNISLFTPKIGQMVILDSEYKFEKWWKALIQNLSPTNP